MVVVPVMRWLALGDVARLVVVEDAVSTHAPPDDMASTVVWTVPPLCTTAASSAPVSATAAGNTEILMLGIFYLARRAAMAPNAVRVLTLNVACATRKMVVVPARLTRKGLIGRMLVDAAVNES